jgi:hypothetical protein
MMTSWGQRNHILLLPGYLADLGMRRHLVALLVLHKDSYLMGARTIRNQVG